MTLREHDEERERIEGMASMSPTFAGNVEPLGYKAFLVGVDREACVLYKEALDATYRPIFRNGH